MPQPSPGRKPAEFLSYTRIGPDVNAPVRAKPTISKGSRLMSTPPAIAMSSRPEAKASQAVLTASNDEEQAPSTT